VIDILPEALPQGVSQPRIQHR